MQRINVSVRARPLSPEDAKTSPWCITGNSIFIPNQPTKFEFDRIFGEETKTLQVYESRTKDIVAAAVRGFNGTVFAYGQTNSGKTHTMRGSATEPGVIPLAVQDLFDIIQEVMDREFLLRMSYMEIYNEEINDLLAPEHRKLQIHESIERGIYVAGLREEIVASAEQVLELLKFGESHRHIGETNMNVYSSRSHTIFRMIIESKDDSQDDDTGGSCDAVRVSVLNLVDLAGSERAAKTGAEGVRLKEGSHINKSLMTLGTVIKKLSEGAESQGSHVPYRDSKLTRILQPALGGNANTAIICNITLAQIHADETKSSLQFASRALRVTNCVIVNEILTDAALLKRQKREIEELRAKLQGSHSEHFEEEILNLRNTLLQTELERERIALELEEEKKAQAEREKRLQEQAKKIENLSSMVLCSNRDDNRNPHKKEKRRDTWCAGKLSEETLRELNSTVHERASAFKPLRSESDVGPLLPFEELVNEVSVIGGCDKENVSSNNAPEDCSIPHPRALLHVTSRRKVPSRKKSLTVGNNDLAQMQKEYEDLLLKFETQRTMSEIQINCLTRKLAETGIEMDNSRNDCMFNSNTNESLNESEAISVIKQLQEKITMLEIEKSSSQKNLDGIVELVTEQQISAKQKFEEIYQDLLNAQEEAKVAREQVISAEPIGLIHEEDSESLINLSREVQEITSEVQTSRNIVENVTSVVDELFQSFSSMVHLFIDLKSQVSQNNSLVKAIIDDHMKLHSCTRSKINELENEKLHLYNQSMDRQNKIEELTLDAQNSAKALSDLSEQQEVEKTELLSEIRNLQKDILGLSSSSLVKEKENMRKDLEKTKTKLRETESKLRNTVQEKTKLEGEKACAEREIKQLHAQKVILERDISKHDSVSGRRRDSVADGSSNVFDTKRSKGLGIFSEQAMLEEYKNLEVLAFEMETTIASLEDELATAREEKEQATSAVESLALQTQDLSYKLNMSNSELRTCEEAVSSLRSSLDESKLHNEKLESSISMLVEEKEELAMQLTDALLAMEEEKAIWSATEKTSIQAIEEKSNLYSAKISSLSSEMSQVKNDLESSREECKVLMERLLLSEESAELVNCQSMKMSQENERLRDDLKAADDHGRRSQELLTSKLEMVSLEHRHACEELDKLRMELSILTKEKEYLSSRICAVDAGSVSLDDFQNLEDQLLNVKSERDRLKIQTEGHQSCGVDYSKENNDQLLKLKAELEKFTKSNSFLEAELHSNKVSNSKEKAKLRMRLRGTQGKLDAFRFRHKEAVDELDFMNRRYEAASTKLKERLASYGVEVLNLKKQLAAEKGAMID